MTDIFWIALPVMLANVNFAVVENWILATVRKFLESSFLRERHFPVGDKNECERDRLFATAM